MKYLNFCILLLMLLSIVMSHEKNIKLDLVLDSLERIEQRLELLDGGIPNKATGA